MVKLNAEMKETFSKIKLFPVATASKSGVPNVAPIAFVMLVSDDTIWLADNYMHKTLANVKENPHIAIYLWEPDSRQCFQIKGKVEVKTSGPEYEKMKATVKAKKDTYPAKSLLVMKITDVFSCVPGAEPGKKTVIVTGIYSLSPFLLFNDSGERFPSTHQWQEVYQEYE